MVVNNINNCMSDLKLVSSNTISQIHANTFYRVRGRVSIHRECSTQLLSMTVHLTLHTHSHTRYCVRQNS